MSTSDALSAIEELVKAKKVFKNSDAYRTAVEAIKHPNTIVSCGKSTGSGRYAATKSWQAQTAHILALAGIKYSLSNNAARGGKNGDNISVHL